MPDYYDDNDGALNDSEIYEHIFEPRGIKSITQHRTKTFEKLKTVTLKVISHYWTQGDTLHRLAIKYYGGPMDWWKIGLINGKPTDGHYKMGDKVLIPVNPENIRV